MDPRLAGLVKIMDLNSKLFNNCLEGLSNEVARQQPNSETHSVAFLACHVVDAREYLAQLLGLDETTGLRDGTQSYADVVAHHDEPPVAAILRAWETVTETTRKRLPELRSEQLDAPSPQSFPIDDRTLFGALVFLLHHESYHIGQAALVRKYYGEGAIRYGHRALLAR